MNYSDELKALVCNRHKKLYPFKVATVKNKDGSTEEFLSCPKCFVVYPYTESIKQSLVRMTEALEAEKGEQDGHQSNPVSDLQQTATEGEKRI